MKLKYFKYLCAYLVPAVVVLSIYLRGYYSYSALIFVFGLVPLIELFTRVDTYNLNAVEEAIAKEDSFYDYLLYLLVPVQFLILAFFLYRVSDTDLATYEIIGLISAYGMACGLAINNAHELGHRNSRFEQFMSKSLLMTSLYMHFFIEHNRGHHLNVATDEDPASSRYGENIYQFYLRTISGSWRSAWALEKKRLRKLGKPFFSLHNEMLVYQIIQLTLLIVIGAGFGSKVLLYFIAGACIGILLLETVNYIEHYGLSRKKIGKRYERTLPVHSWNSNHPFGRMIMLELSRHSDHHFIADRKYQLLRHFEESPQMPTGYPGMMLLALIPPLWFNVMHHRIENYRELLEPSTETMRSA
jgi:alkane 1-monooxygenase